MSTAVLATKLFAPARRAQGVERTRLLEQLHTTLVPGHRLTLVSAPAGFGKTTAVCDWIDHLDRRPDLQARAGWVSLDEADNDLARLLAHLVAALASMGVDLEAAAVLDRLPGEASEALTTVVNAAARAAERAPKVQRVLILDDYHVITSHQVHEAVTFFLEHLPAQLHLVIATRADPPLPVARLRTRGQLTEVRGADLRFTRQEAHQFLHQTMQLDLHANEVVALDGRTEGWIAGLQLAALSLRAIPSGPEVTSFIDAFTGSNRFVIDYLVDEVLARQSLDVRDFLLRTAVLDRLTGPLCDAVSGQSAGAGTLAALEHQNLFVVALDTQRVWYRYHHLFADMLHARLLNDHPALVPQLHRCATDWYASQGMIADAVRHALSAKDFDRAAYLMQQALPDARRARQDDLLLTWIRALPDTLVRSNPVLSLLAGWAQMMSGDLDGLQARLDDADAALQAGARDPTLAAQWADTEDLRTAPATILVYRSSLAQARGDVAGTVRHAQQALDLAGPGDHLVRGAAGGFLGLAAWAAGNLDEAVPTFSDAVRSLHAAGNLVDELDTTVVLADMWVAAGRPSRARQVYELALRTATGHGEPYPRATADLHVGLAELDLELDELSRSETHLQTAATLAERASISENRYRWPQVMAGVRAARGDHEAAMRLLDRAQELHRAGFYPDVRPIHAMRARLQIAVGDLESVEAWADARGLSVDDEPQYLREFEHLTLARLLLAQRRSAQRSGVPDVSDVSGLLGLLGRLHGAAAERGRGRSLLEIRMLQALAHHADGEVDTALELLGQAVVDAAEPLSHLRLFLDEGTAMQQLLAAAASDRGQPRRNADRHGEDTHLRTWARRLLERLEISRGAEPGAPSPLSDPLSPREIEVLRLLDSELTGPQIAEQLYISVNTLRSHTKRIFTKLDVKTRASAVRCAREHGLI